MTSGEEAEVSLGVMVEVLYMSSILTRMKQIVGGELTIQPSAPVIKVIFIVGVLVQELDLILMQRMVNVPE